MNKEVIRRLHQAFKSDKVIKDIQSRIVRFYTYNSQSYTGGTPEVPQVVAMYQDMIKKYTADQWPMFYSEHIQVSDRIIAMRYAQFANTEQKLLSTKSKTNRGVLECIDNRLDLYLIWQEKWLNYTDFEPPRFMDGFNSYFYREPIQFLTFPQWLYECGYEVYLSDREFLDVIYNLDK